MFVPNILYVPNSWDTLVTLARNSNDLDKLNLHGVSNATADKASYVFID